MAEEDEILRFAQDDNRAKQQGCLRWHAEGISVMLSAAKHLAADPERSEG